MTAEKCKTIAETAKIVMELLWGWSDRRDKKREVEDARQRELEELRRRVRELEDK